MNIVIIANNYPYKHSNNYVFVKQLVDKWVTMGHNCTVIAPLSITKRIKNKILKRPYIYKYENYNLYSPKFISFGKISILGKIGRYLFNNAVLSTIKKEKLEIDLIYAHFMVSAGVAAAYCSERLNKPYFIAFGESTFKFEEFYAKEIINKVFNFCSGYIAVSNEVKTRLLKLPYNIDPSKIGVFPNSFDSNKFYKIDKITVRKELGFNLDDFIIIFVGAFIERKGLMRLDQALIEINNSNIKAIYIGSGKDIPKYPYTIFKRIVKHNDIVKYLNASDIFILPTLHEGSCNAIIEAVACGLPIISSNDTFNDDILDDSYSIRINSNNIAEIKKAIEKLYFNDVLRGKMARCALESAKVFNLDKRANNIMNFIKTNINSKK